MSSTCIPNFTQGLTKPSLNPEGDRSVEERGVAERTGFDGLARTWCDMEVLPKRPKGLGRTRARIQLPDLCSALLLRLLRCGRASLSGSGF